MGHVRTILSVLFIISSPLAARHPLFPRLSLFLSEIPTKLHGLTRPDRVPSRGCLTREIHRIAARKSPRYTTGRSQLIPGKFAKKRPACPVVRELSKTARMQFLARAQAQLVFLKTGLAFHARGDSSSVFPPFFFLRCHTYVFVRRCAPRINYSRFLCIPHPRSPRFTCDFC